MTEQRNPTERGSAFGNPEFRTLPGNNPITTNEMTLEHARLGYQTAIALWTYQGNLNWSRFTIMVGVHSLIISAIGIMLSGDATEPLLSAVLMVVGLILCGVWSALSVRGFAYHAYWSGCARELEKRYLSDVIAIVARAKSTESGGSVSFKPLARAGGQKEVRQLMRGLFVCVYN